MKRLNVVSVVLVAVFAIVIAGCNGSYQGTDIDPSLGDRLECRRIGGAWYKMIVGLNHCSEMLDVGTAKLSYAAEEACDCGMGRCWNGETCVAGGSCLTDDIDCLVEPSEEEECIEAGGEWREFSDGCADACGVTEDSICTQALTFSCDCGAGRCWTGAYIFMCFDEPVVDNTEPISAAALAEYQACTDDADCVYVNNGCCDCANGGEEAAINRNFLGEFTAEFNCDGIACTARARIPSCGSGVVSCVDGMCGYTL